MATYDTNSLSGANGETFGGEKVENFFLATQINQFVASATGDPNVQFSIENDSLAGGVSSSAIVIQGASGQVEALFTFTGPQDSTGGAGGDPGAPPEPPVVFSITLVEGLGLTGDTDTVEAVQFATIDELQQDTTATAPEAVALGAEAQKPAAAVEARQDLLAVYRDVQESLATENQGASTLTPDEIKKVQNVVSQALEAFAAVVAPTQSGTEPPPLTPVQVLQITAITSALKNAISDIPDGVLVADVAAKFITLTASVTGGGTIPLIDSDVTIQIAGDLDSGGSFQGVDSLVGANEILLDASSSTKYDLFALNLAFVQGNTVVLKAVDAAVLAGPGSIRVDGDVPISVTSDNQAHNVTGGGGNDTLVGTGNDTLTGGGGKDLFGFAAPGKYTITDFNKAADSFQFELKGITNVDQLKAAVTSVAVAKGAITYNFGPDTSITLVGVSPGSITADMLSFKIVG